MKRVEGRKKGEEEVLRVGKGGWEGLRTLKFVPVELFLANLQPLGFEIWPNI